MSPFQEHVKNLSNRQFVWGEWDCIHWVESWLATRAQSRSKAKAIRNFLAQTNYKERVSSERTFLKFMQEQKLEFAADIQKEFFMRGFLPSMGFENDTAILPDRTMGIVGADGKGVFLSPEGGFTCVNPPAGTLFVK